MKPLMLSLLILPFSLAHASKDCQSLYEKHLASDMGLSYEEFDQTMGSGFRVLAAEGCSKEAADLIVEYIRVNSAKQSSLRWHISQLRAAHGDKEQAIQYARTTLLETEDFTTRALRWNDYVLATIAYLEGDMAALRHHRDNVEKGVGEHPGNAMNLRLLDTFVTELNARDVSAR